MKLLLGALLLCGMVDDYGDAARDAKALELYLQDRSDHAIYCPHLPWEQPDIEVYKRELSSQLPEGCKS